LLYYAFAVLFILVFYCKPKTKRLLGATSFLSLCLLAALPVYSNATKQVSISTSVSILDVGHGSASFLQLPNNKTVLIDGGGPGTDYFDIGERIIGPFLWYNKISRLDAVIISHPHADHYNGLEFILKHFRPETLWINGWPWADPAYKRLLDLARTLDIEIKIPGTNQVILESGPAKLMCLSCDEIIDGKDLSRSLIHKKYGTDINDSSLVLKLETGNGSVLFPGDINSNTIDKLAKKKNLQADVLLAPHHGSRSSLTENTVNFIKPDYLAISAGRQNKFILAHEFFSTLEKNEIRILNTSQDGTLKFTFNTDGIILSRYQLN
jgi:competence protein ComEC